MSLAPRARYLSTPGRGLCAEFAFACGRRACFAKSPESVTLVEFGSPPRRLGLAPVRRASAPDGFIRDPRRDTSSRNTASSSRAGLAANPPNRVRPAHSARHAPPRIRASPRSGILLTPCGRANRPLRTGSTCAVESEAFEGRVAKQRRSRPQSPALRRSRAHADRHTGRLAV